jgi:hypothetical protein
LGIAEGQVGFSDEIAGFTYKALQKSTRLRHHWKANTIECC